MIVTCGHAGTALSRLWHGRGARQTRRVRTRGGARGDAAFTCGITFEALNNIAHHTEKLLVILNDNEWSIDKTSELLPLT